MTTVPKNDPTHVIAYDRSDIDGLCVTNDAQTMQVKLAKRKDYKTGVEFQMSLNMNEDVFDTTNFGAFGPGGKNGGGYGQICMDGGAGFVGGQSAKVVNGETVLGSSQLQVELDVHDSQRVKFNESWFGARELGEICDNLMSFRHYDRWEKLEGRDESRTDYGALAGCDEAALAMDEKNQQRETAHTTQEICEKNQLSWDGAQQACETVTKPAFKEACLWEYCNDNGDPNAAQIAEGVEEDAEAAQASADESHQSELNFVPEECCLDDLNCDKEFSLR